MFKRLLIPYWCIIKFVRHTSRIIWVVSNLTYLNLIVVYFINTLIWIELTHLFAIRYWFKKIYARIFLFLSAKLNWFLAFWDIMSIAKHYVVYAFITLNNFVKLGIPRLRWNVFHLFLPKFSVSPTIHHPRFGIVYCKIDNFILMLCKIARVTLILTWLVMIAHFN